MIALDSWLGQATRHLAKDSVSRVRSEIQEHFESTRDAAIADGATVEQADTFALKALGDAKAANRQYRRVLLTAAEARMLRSDNWEARAICSRPWLKWIAAGVFVAVLCAAAAFVLTPHAGAGRDVLALAIGMSPLSGALFLPIRTPARGRVFRAVKWIATTVAVALVFGPELLKWSWLLISCTSSSRWARNTSIPRF
jgi:molecular chaperone DnaK (HSP70)